MPTTPVYRFEAWPDFTADHPDTVRLITSTLPYFDPTVWVFPAGATDAEKISAIVAEYQSGKQRIAEDPIAESFSFKQYKDDVLVGIYTGIAVECGSEGKTYTSHGTFLGEDADGSREWAKKGNVAAFDGLEEFMNGEGITYYAVPYPAGHAQVARHTHLGLQPDKTETKVKPDGTEETVVVFNLFDVIRQWKENNPPV